MRALLAITLIPLMLLSTTGVRISQHWCGDELVNATIWGEAKVCDHFSQDSEPVCPMHSESVINKKCCDQREIIVDSNHYEYEVQAIESVTAPTILIAVMYCIRAIFKPEADVILSKYRNHSPPLIGSEIIIRVQSFLL